MITAKIVSGCNTYYGPDTTVYPVGGSVDTNEEVIVLWREGNYYLIEYGTSNGQKRMYVPIGSLKEIYGGTIEVYLPPEDEIRYVIKACEVYTGSSAEFVVAGSVNLYESVKYLGKKENNYAFIEYDISNSQKKRAWIYANNLGTAEPPQPKIFDYFSNGYGNNFDFGEKNGSTHHIGVDIGQNTSRDVLAIADGKVVAITGEQENNGIVIVLEHNLSGIPTFYSFYAHLADVTHVVTLNQNVLAGQKIHEEYGETGNVTGPHIHLGIYTGTMTSNPYGYTEDVISSSTSSVYKSGRTYYNYNTVLSSDGSIIG